MTQFWTPWADFRNSRIPPNPLRGPRLNQCTIRSSPKKMRIGPSSGDGFPRRRLSTAMAVATA
ncbi:MAG: hypothetical protein EBZ78_08750, partial [Verrucomicrobia bacterium]|nr:hypothetical protein [Verrucomicrobiota bacterium]